MSNLNREKMSGVSKSRANIGQALLYSPSTDPAKMLQREKDASACWSALLARVGPHNCDARWTPKHFCRSLVAQERPGRKESEEKAALQLSYCMDGQEIAARGLSHIQPALQNARSISAAATLANTCTALDLSRWPVQPCFCPAGSDDPHRTGWLTRSSLAAPVATTACPSPGCAQRKSRGVGSQARKLHNEK